MLKIIIKMCKYLESFNPVWRTDLVSVGLATPRYLHLMWYIREACARTENLNILMPEDAPRAGTITSRNVSLNLFFVLMGHLKCPCGALKHSFLWWYPPWTCFRLAFQQEKGYMGNGTSVSGPNFLFLRGENWFGNVYFSWICQLKSSFEVDYNEKPEPFSPVK